MLHCTCRYEAVQFGLFNLLLHILCHSCAKLNLGVADVYACSHVTLSEILHAHIHDELYLDAPSLPYLLPTKLNIFIYCDSDLRPCEEARHKMLERSQHPAVSIYYAFSIQH